MDFGKIKYLINVRWDCYFFTNKKKLEKFGVVLLLFLKKLLKASSSFVKLIAITFKHNSQSAYFFDIRFSPLNLRRHSANAVVVPSRFFFTTAKFCRHNNFDITLVKVIVTPTNVFTLFQALSRRHSRCLLVTCLHS